jgi:hypothetical protein
MPSALTPPSTKQVMLDVVFPRPGAKISFVRHEVDDIIVSSGVAE